MTHDTPTRKRARRLRDEASALSKQEHALATKGSEDLAEKMAGQGVEG
jgi:hypothetical protein